MEKKSAQVIVTEHEPRRSRSLRRFTTFLEIRRSRSSRTQLNEHEKNSFEKACKGPTFLHNLLPFLDLLAIVTPKASSYEDRIIGRSRAEYSDVPFRIPTSLSELRQWADEDRQSCDCDVCDPKSYQKGPKSSHRSLEISDRMPRKPRSRFHNEARNAPHFLRGLKPKLYGDYELMHLVRSHTGWLDETYLQVSEKQPTVHISRLRSLLDAWRSNMTGSDLRQTVSRTQLLHLFDILNQAFFRGAVPGHRPSISTGFSWLPEAQKNCFGIGSYNALLGTQIALHPILYRGQNQCPAGSTTDLDLRWRNRIGTMLHEMCHAFLKAYSCRSCPSHDVCMGAGGHGRAWQILAAKVEQTATRLLDGYVDMGRYPSMLSEIQASGKLPSRHDLEVYHFGTPWDTVLS